MCKCIMGATPIVGGNYRGLYIVSVSVVQNPDKNEQGDGGVVHIHVPTIAHMVFIIR